MHGGEIRVNTSDILKPEPDSGWAPPMVRVPFQCPPPTAAHSIAEAREQKDVVKD